MLARSQEKLFSSDIWPLSIGLFLVVVAPFLSIYRVGPLNSYFLEAASLLGVLVLVWLSAFSGCLKHRLPRASVYFLLLAVFWAMQARVMDLTYVGLSDMVSWSFVILALGCWAAQGWVLKIGSERALSLLAAMLVLGSTLQAAVGWLQYTDLAGNFSDYLMYRTGIVEGQLAQRNHYGHYMMWGVISLAWLWAQRRLPVWISVILLILFASVMALTGSRTIFAYVLAIVILVPVVGMLSGSLKTRVNVGLLVVAATVLLFQFALEPILALFNSNVQTAAERLGGQFGQSGRGYEWQKAWQIFLSAPWFGYGWGSYPLQGFLTNNYPTGFRPYETGVLFTHSHNSFLNLLAEMGLVGTILVLGGLLWALWGCFKRGQGVAGVFLLALICVSLAHSFVEYPLWYIYFLSVFALLIGFAPPAHQPENTHQTIFARFGNRLGWILPVVFAVGIVRLSFAYQDLREYSATQQSIEARTQSVMGLTMVAHSEPMFRYYAELELMKYFDGKGDSISPVPATTIHDASKLRPYSLAYKWGLMAAREGKIEEARTWMQALYRYYPNRFQEWGNIIMQHEVYMPLRADYTATCLAYYQSIKQAPQCVAEP